MTGLEVRRCNWDDRPDMFQVGRSMNSGLQVVLLYNRFS